MKIRLKKVKEGNNGGEFIDIKITPESEKEKEELKNSDHSDIFIDKKGNLRIFLSE